MALDTKYTVKICDHAGQILWAGFVEPSAFTVLYDNEIPAPYIAGYGIILPASVQTYLDESDLQDVDRYRLLIEDLEKAAQAAQDLHEGRTG